MEQLLMKKMIRQSLAQYNFASEGKEAEVLYKELIQRIQKHQAEHDGELYEIIEDVVYEFITSI
ncbi:YqzH family protein [Bacillus sp. B190/17]|uniref:YqzH family protein n=1 Tax=Bacillus lumedeiriae TaxID=3058829 RepID=A0ABW8I6B8_9BACI